MANKKLLQESSEWETLHKTAISATGNLFTQTFYDVII